MPGNSDPKFFKVKLQFESVFQGTKARARSPGMKKSINWPRRQPKRAKVLDRAFNVFLLRALLLAKGPARSYPLRDSG